MSAIADYPEHHRELQQLVGRLQEAAPEVTRGFAALHRGALAEGALDAKTKELMAVAISVATHCDPCIAYHVHDALRAGATREELAETIGVAVMMAGGPGLTYGAQALLAVDQFTGNAPSAP